MRSTMLVFFLAITGCSSSDEPAVTGPTPDTGAETSVDSTTPDTDTPDTDTPDTDTPDTDTPDTKVADSAMADTTPADTSSDATPADTLAADTSSSDGASDDAMTTDAADDAAPSCATNADCGFGMYCDGPTCDGPGTCRKRPGIGITCKMDGTWCGCDHVNYTSECAAQKLGVRIAHSGPC